MNLDDYRNTIIIGAVISAIVVPVPETKCPSCKYAEYTRFQQLCFRYPKSNGIGDIMRVAMGAVPYDSYAYHREIWIQDGDIKELTRMLRHVTAS
jgi:hypothetical protein